MQAGQPPDVRVMVPSSSCVARLNPSGSVMAEARSTQARSATWRNWFTSRVLISSGYSDDFQASRRSLCAQSGQRRNFVRELSRHRGNDLVFTPRQEERLNFLGFSLKAHSGHQFIVEIAASAPIPPTYSASPSFTDCSQASISSVTLIVSPCMISCGGR